MRDNNIVAAALVFDYGIVFFDHAVSNSINGSVFGLFTALQLFIHFSNIGVTLNVHILKIFLKVPKSRKKL